MLTLPCHGGEENGRRLQSMVPHRVETDNNFTIAV